MHHVIPFHLDPAKELDRTNLIVLCMAYPQECHLQIGHGGYFKAYNPNVIADSKAMLLAWKTFDSQLKASVLTAAFEHRKLAL